MLAAFPSPLWVAFVAALAAVIAPLTTLVVSILRNGHERRMKDDDRIFELRRVFAESVLLAAFELQGWLAEMEPAWGKEDHPKRPPTAEFNNADMRMRATLYTSANARGKLDRVIKAIIATDDLPAESSSIELRSRVVETTNAVESLMEALRTDVAVGRAGRRRFFRL